MFKLNEGEILFVALIFESFLYGLYSGIYAIYLRYYWQTSRGDAVRKQSVVSYSIRVLYVLSVALFVADITQVACQLLRKPVDSMRRVSFIQNTLFGCCDLIAQFILIYRCWIVWGCNTRVVIIPGMLTIAFIGAWLASGSAVYITPSNNVTTNWAYSMYLLGLALSLTVNALVTSLIVFKIFMVFRQVGTSNDRSLGTTGGTKLRRTIMILIESGMVLFSAQLARLVVTLVEMNAQVTLAFTAIVGIHEMLTGITPTIILVRTSMGLSFHDEKSMEECAVGSLRFAPYHSNSADETGSTTVVDQDIDIEQCNVINSLER